jgi:D-xylose transport system substrate-binding protein
MAAEKPKVGFLWDSTQYERRVTEANLIRERSKVDGWEMVFQSANNDDKLQITQGEAMISQGVKLLVIQAVNMFTSSAIVDAAHKAGIPVIDYDRPMKNSIPDVFIGFNYAGVGDVAASYVVKRVPKGNYALICGDPADDTAVMFREGYYRVLKPYVDRKDITIVSDQFTPGWDGGTALKTAENVLTGNKNNISVFLVSNDTMANGVIQALRGQGLIGKVLVTGLDAEKTALQRIVQGEQTMSIWQPAKKLAQLAGDTIKAMLAGKTPTTNTKFNNGIADIPANLLDLMVVDKDNIMSTVVAAGARTVDEIYANVPKNQWPKK